MSRFRTATGSAIHRNKEPSDWPPRGCVRPDADYDCGLRPEHKQHICLALIAVNTACNRNCPVRFANAGIGYSLTLA